jgi:hypothetical protein
MTASAYADPAAASARLRLALESVAAALAAARLDDMLTAEAELESALADVARLPPLSPADRQLIRDQADAARRALMRCRRLGSNLGEFARASFEARGTAVGYDPARAAATAMNGRSLQTRA